MPRPCHLPLSLAAYAQYPGPPCEEAILDSLLAWDGGLTLLAPVVAIAAALVTRRVVPSLVAAVTVGAWVLARGSLGGTLAALAEHVSAVVTDADNLTISAFSVAVAATVGVMGASGGTAALVGLIERVARGRRGAMGATAAAGGVVFFDDYANCLVVGSAMGPLCDRSGVSRAKLAYLVDSTAAPIASLAVVSTWVGYEVGLLDDALAGLSAEAPSAFALFLQALPYRFYCILTLFFVAAIALTGRDYGPMRRLEANPPPPPDAAESAARGRGGPWHAGLPVLALVLVTFGLLVSDGRRSLGPDAATAPLFEVLGAADPFFAMLVGGVVAWLLAGGLAMTAGLSPREVAAGSWGMVRNVLPALLVLYLAWTLGGLIKEAGTASFIAGALDGRLSPVALPAVVFLLAALTSFSTGSSFFTMGALIPLVVPLAHEMGGGAVGAVLLASTAAVLDGAVLGDHASPISDTTILSSLGAGTDVVTHVRTQLPYALTVGGIAVAVGAIPVVALGTSPWLSVAVGAAACGAVVRLVGKPPSAGAGPSLEANGGLRVEA